MAAVRWRSLSRTSPHSRLFHPCRNLSASSNGNRFQPAGSDFKSMLSEPKSQADIEVAVEEETPTSKPNPKAVSSSSLFEDVRASLRKPSQPTPKVALEDIRKNLSEFRTKSAPPTGVDGKERLSFESVGGGLSQICSSAPGILNGNESAGSFSLEAFGESLMIQPGKGPGPGPRPRPSSLKRSDIPLRFARQPLRPPQRELMKMYSYEELGAKLRKLRPQDEKRFSLTEFNDRLRKLREMEEEEESKSNTGGLSFKVLRESLSQLRMSSETSNKKSSLQRLALLGQLGGQPAPF